MEQLLSANFRALEGLLVDCHPHHGTFFRFRDSSLESRVSLRQGDRKGLREKIRKTAEVGVGTTARR